jgi:DNA-directed RNA polymerase subunit H (RpoH/RPB5)
MNESNSVFVSTVYKTRKILMDILKERGYNVSEYSNFSIGEINILIEKNQLDFIVMNTEGNKVYVKYEMKSLNKRKFYNNYEQLFEMGEILDKKKDELLYILVNEVNNSTVKLLNEVWNTEGAFVSALSLKRLQFNILKHKLVPKHRILSEEETKLFKEKYNVNNEVTELPEISRYDPVALAIGLRPGEICEITRKSKTSLDTKYYRICIQ